MSIWGPQELSPEQKRLRDELVIKFIALRELLKKHPEGGSEAAKLLYEKVHVINELETEALLSEDQRASLNKFFKILPDSEQDLDKRSIKLLQEVINELLPELQQD